MAMILMTQYNPKFQEIHQRLVAAGKPKSSDNNLYQKVSYRYLCDDEKRCYVIS